MADATKIEWADSTFNPWIGCTKISTAHTGGGGCDGCYAAESTPVRVMRGKGTETWGPGAPRQRTSASNWQQPLAWNKRWFLQCPDCGWRGDRPASLGDVAVCPRTDCASIELRLTRRRVFCASLADVFDNEVDPAWRADLFRLIAETPNLDWLLLTKRIGNAGRMIEQALDMLSTTLRGMPWPWSNVWLGATVVNQVEADRDLHKLLTTRAAVKFLSIEPMLGPISLDCFPIYGENEAPLLDWVICGGESGPNARPMNPAWVRALRDQCEDGRVPFLFKQWGEWADAFECVGGEHRIVTWGDGSIAARVGKKNAGRLLDGAEHSGFPEVRP